MKHMYPKILVISNNAFSKTKNNGKTLASFFSMIPTDSIAQLYFYNEKPTMDVCKNFFRITDIDILKSYINKKYSIYSVFDNESNARISKQTNVSQLFKGNLFRLGREFLWKHGQWNSRELNQWLDSFKPEMIFFCAGDTGFVYDIVEYIQKKYNAKLTIYITDDYILPRKTLAPFWWIRRNYILNKMTIAVHRSDFFLTISQEMRHEYHTIFKKDSHIAMNLSDSIKENDTNKTNSPKPFTKLIYAGGLNFNRYETLRILGKSIEKYNSDSKGNKVYLEIYSGIEPENRIKKKLNINGACKYSGSLNYDSLKTVLNDSDILVFVESFNKKSIDSTRLSISTKISEYLSLGKPILAIGPQEIASIRYLSESAYCITNIKEIDDMFDRFIRDLELQNRLSILALSLFKKNHTKRDLISSLFLDQDQ